MTDYARGYRDGQEAMWKECFTIAFDHGIGKSNEAFIAAQEIAAALRALPLREPGER